MNKVAHSKTLAAYALDPTDPMAKTPVAFGESLASYGSFWRFLGNKKVYKYLELFFILDRVSYDYRVFSGNAPDAFGAFIPFPFKSYFLWYSSFGDTVVDYTVGGTESIITTEGESQYFKLLEATGFRVRNLVAGSNVQYQLVIFR
jgi:hypothetical protein